MSRGPAAPVSRAMSQAPAAPVPEAMSTGAAVPPARSPAAPVPPARPPAAPVPPASSPAAPRVLLLALTRSPGLARAAPAKPVAPPPMPAPTRSAAIEAFNAHLQARPDASDRAAVKDLIISEPGRPARRRPPRRASPPRARRAAVARGPRRDPQDQPCSIHAGAAARPRPRDPARQTPSHRALGGRTVDLARETLRLRPGQAPPPCAGQSPAAWSPRAQAASSVDASGSLC